MRWLQVYAPDTASLLDDSMLGYFDYIARKHGLSVLCCVVFFAMGHPQEHRGESPPRQVSCPAHQLAAL
jgi:hypothetical protein